MRYQIRQMKLDIWIHTYSTTRTFKCHIHSSHIMRCIHRFVMYEAYALYTRPPYAIESRWPPSVRGLYAVHTPLALWIRNGQVLIGDIIRSGIAIHTQYVPQVRHQCSIDTQLIRNTCEIVAPEIFHQTISAILLRISSFSPCCPAARLPSVPSDSRSCHMTHHFPYPDGVAIECLWSVDGVHYFHRPECTLRCHSNLMEWYWSGIGVA